MVPSEDEFKAILARCATLIDGLLEAHGIAHYNARSLLAIIYGAYCKTDNVPDEVAIAMIRRELDINEKIARFCNCPNCAKRREDAPH
jgi:hypothetical protein